MNTLHTLVRMAGPTAVLLLLAGCQRALTGDWHTVDLGQNRQVFSIDDAQFRADGTYTATTILEGVTHREKGTYDFTGVKLRMRPERGGQRTYTATLLANRLQLIDGQRKVVLGRGKRGG